MSHPFFHAHVVTAGYSEGSDYAVAAEEYGYHLGMAYQIVDDILDFTGATYIFTPCSHNPTNASSHPYHTLLLTRSPTYLNAYSGIHFDTHPYAHPMTLLTFLFILISRQEPLRR